MGRFWSGLSPASRRLLAVGAGLLLVMVTAVTVTMWDMRRVELEDVRRNVSKLGIAISEQTTRSIQAVDIEMQQLQKDIFADGIDTPEKFSTSLHTRELQAQLQHRDEALPQAEAFTIIDAAGKLVNFSREWPIPPTDLADRDYYKYFRTHDDPGVFISDPVQNRGNGGWTSYVVRRVDSPTGQFLGMVLGAIDLSYFRDFYQALTAGAGTTVTLLKRDGVALTSYPTTARIGERLPPTTPWHQMVARRKPDTFVTEGILAPGLRVVSVHPLLDYPLVVNVSVSVADSLAHWRQATWLAAGGTTSAVLCVILLLRALSLQLQRLESSEASFARQNARLESTQRRLELQALELQASRKQLAAESDALETTLDHMNQGIMMIQADRTVAVCNERAMQMLDLPSQLMQRHPSFDEVVEHQRSLNEFAGADTPPWAGRGDPSKSPLTYERQRPNGRILEIQSVPLTNGGMVRTYTDITERRISEERVRYFAHHDDLTKLVNRVVFQQRLEDAIHWADQASRSAAVLYLDLDRFKLVNDTRGHGVGDKLLVQVAGRLRAAVREMDTVARMGGDEFAIIQPLLEHPYSSARLAERVSHIVRQPFEIDGVRCSVGVSVGIAHYPEHAKTASELLRNADIALYRAKSEGRGGHRLFEANMDARQQELFVLEQELRQAVDLGQLEVEYQPIVETLSRRVIACEALLRWRHPTRGLIGPSEFIGLAESCGLIIPIGHWVLDAACREAASWPPEIGVSVNLSPLQFNQDSVIGELIAIATRAQLPLSRLILEVTEGLLLEESRVVLSTMSRLRALGVRFSLDDFGTAHAGLSYLRRFPFDTIKIDKSFVQDTVGQSEARAIVAAVLSIATALHLGVVAEGVETEAQMAEMRRLGCPHVQGYLTGRPVPAAEIRKYISRTNAEPAAAE